jgi:AAHS family 4-hydroxybenzoate transporter-like MFS transporter
MDRFGPIKPLKTGAACAVLVGILLAATGLDATHEVWMIAGMGALGAFVNGSQTMLFALGAHVYRPECRGAGVGIALAVGRVGAVASSFAGAMLLGAGTGAYFGVIAFAMLVTVGSLAIVAYAQR